MHTQRQKKKWTLCRQDVTLCAKKKTTKSNQCTVSQQKATSSQCQYYDTKKQACDNYKLCHSDAKKDWLEAKARETADSADRKRGWATAKKIACLADSFKTTKTGNVEIDPDASLKCSKITCDPECNTALDLTTSLNRPIPAEASCGLPSKPCSGWKPGCNGDETSSWGDHTPLYSVGARTGSQCKVTAVKMGLAIGQVTEECQQCGGK